MKSARTKATDITPKVRKEIHERDKHCIVCGAYHSLQIAHIFIPRSKGGLGVKENLALLCVSCHMKLDNGRQKESIVIKDNVEMYMRRKYPHLDLEKLKYKKEFI